MMEDDEDDLYAPEDVLEEKPDPIALIDAMDEDEEAEDEEDEESDSDIEIVTEQKEPTTDSSKLASRAVSRPETSTPAPASTTRPAPTIANPPSPPPNQKPGSSYPAVRTSTLDIDAKPTHPSSGKPITELDIDVDLPDEKSWRIPGSDQTDYFNYGFDEFTWAAYCLKQTSLRAEAKEQKKALGEFQNMFGGNTATASMGAGVGMGAANGMGNNAAVANPAAGNMMAGFPGDIPPEMVPAMQAMMASGMDPSQMDMGAFMQMMGGGNANQGFGAQGVAGMGGGYDAYGGQGGHGGGGGGRRGRGRGRW